MRIKNLLQLVFIMIAGQLLFSCNSAKYYEFAASKQAPYKVTKAKPAPQTVSEAPASITTIAMDAATAEESKIQVAPELVASTLPATTVKSPKAISEVEKVTAPVSTITEAEALALAKERVNNMTKAEKKELKKEMKEVMRQSSTVSIVEIILAILLPPLAVFLHDGLGTTFWISLLLTLLFWIPGVIYALLVVTDTI